MYKYVHIYLILVLTIKVNGNYKQDFVETQ